MCVLGTHVGQKRASGPLDLKLQMVVSRHVDTGSGNWASAPNGSVTFPALDLFFFPEKGFFIGPELTNSAKPADK